MFQFFLVASDIQNMQQALHDSEKKAITYMKRYSRVQVSSLFVLMNVYVRFLIEKKIISVLQIAILCFQSRLKSIFPK